MSVGKYKELTKNTLLFTISSFGTRIISFLLVPLYTYTLSTAEYGIIDVIHTTVSLLIPILTVNVQDAVLRFTLDRSYDPKEVISNAIKVISFSSFIITVLTLLIKSSGLIVLSWEYVLFFLVSYITSSLQNSFSMYLRSKDKVTTIVVAGLLSTLLTCGLNILFLLVIRLGVVGYLVSSMVASSVGTLFCFFHGKIYKDIRLRNNTSILKVMLVYSYPLIVNSVAWWLNDASDRYILTFFCGTAVNGLYAVAYKIPTILASVQSVFYNAWSVSSIKEFNSDDGDGFVGNIYSLYSCVSIVGCSIILILNPYFARVLYANDYYSAWHYVPPLLVGAVFNGLALFEGCLFTAVKRTKDVSKTTIIGAAVNTVLNFILIPFYGAYGAAFATMIGYVSIWIVRTKTLSTIIKMKVNWVSHVASLVLVIIQGLLAINEKGRWLQIPIIILVILLQWSFLNRVRTSIMYILHNKGNTF